MEKVILSKITKESAVDFKYVIVDGKVIISEYLGTDTDVIIPSEINGYKVTEIAPYAFEGKKIENVTMSDGLEIIGTGAFAECKSLTNIIISASVLKIDESAFIHCTSLSNVTLPDNLEYIGETAFLNTGIQQIAIPSSVKYIGEKAFKGCKNLIAVHIDGENLEQIQRQTFIDCTKLINVSFGKKCAINTIHESAFESCGRLTKIELPDSIRLIEINAFRHCFILSEVIFPDEQVTVRESAFFGCKFDAHRNKNITLKSDPFKRQVKEIISDLGTEGIAVFLLTGWIGIVILFGVLALIFGWG